MYQHAFGFFIFIDLKKLLISVKNASVTRDWYIFRISFS